MAPVFKKDSDPGETDSKKLGTVFKSRRLLINPQLKWHEVKLPPEVLVHKKDSFVPVNSLKQKAERLLSEDALRYKETQTHNNGKHDFKWLRTVLMSGTMGDRIAAHTILVQESAVHHLHCIDSLIDMVSVKGKRECLMAMDALRDLFLGDLLPENQKLKKFELQPHWCLENMNSQESRNQFLVYWYFEDQLKLRYTKFLNAVESVSHDTVEKTKEKAASVMYELLAGHPEQEQFLLQKLVNKLGDLSKKVTAKVCHLLNQLVIQHPNMKACVVEEVERMMYRPNIGGRAQYCALCFLNEIILSPEDFILADRLVNIYFSFFKASVKKGEVDTKTMKALLVGVRRAYPFLKDKQEMLVERLEMMYRIVHLVSFNISIQALMLIFQVLESKHDISDRFYNVLYRKLLDKQFARSPHQAMLFNLIYKALKIDHQIERVKAFAKRMLQICEYLPPQSVCGILIMISELRKTHRKLLDGGNSMNAALVEDDDVETFQDVDDTIEEAQLLSDEASNQVTPNAEQKSSVTSSWVHSRNQHNYLSNSYDPYHRNPLFARAGLCAFWELHRLARNFHPSVALFAQNLIDNNTIEYTGDPLQDFTHTNFLDRFVYRNPKKVPPLAVSQRVFGRRKQYVPMGVRHIQPNTPSYVNQKLEKVPLEERFLFKYLQQRNLKKQDDDFDVESVASDEFEAYLDTLEGKANTDLNFADEFTDKKKKKKSKQGSETDEDDSDDDDVSDDEEVEFDNDDFGDAFKDYDHINDLTDEEGGLKDYGDAFEDFDGMPKPAKKRRKGDSDKFNPSRMFSAAEELSELLDENADSDIDANSDQAHSKKGKSGKWGKQKGQQVQHKNRAAMKRKGFRGKQKKTVGKNTKKMRKK